MKLWHLYQVHVKPMYNNLFSFAVLDQERENSSHALEVNSKNMNASDAISSHETIKANEKKGNKFIKSEVVL